MDFALEGEECRLKRLSKTYSYLIEYELLGKTYVYPVDAYVELVAACKKIKNIPMVIKRVESVFVKVSDLVNDRCIFCGDSIGDKRDFCCEDEECQYFKNVFEACCYHYEVYEPEKTDDLMISLDNLIEIKCFCKDTIEDDEAQMLILFSKNWVELDLNSILDGKCQECGVLIGEGSQFCECCFKEFVSENSYLGREFVVVLFGEIGRGVY